MRQRVVPIAIIGFGNIAARLADDRAMGAAFECAAHVQAIASNPGFDLVGIVDSDEEARKYAGDRWQVPCAKDSIEALAAEVDPEVVVLTVPPNVRPTIIQALPSLQAVVVEKPLGENGRQFLDLCADRGILVQVNYWRRADSAIRALAAGGLYETIGAPQCAFATYGNGILNNGSHLIDEIRLLVGEVHSVRALTPGVRNDRLSLPEDLQLQFVLHLEGGCTVLVSPLDFSHYREISLDVWGEVGRLEILQEGLRLYVTSRGPNRGLDGAEELVSERRNAIQAGASRALCDLYANLAAAIEGSATLWSSGESAFRSEEVIRAILTSADSGCDRVQVSNPAGP